MAETDFVYLNWYSVAFVLASLVQQLIGAMIVLIPLACGGKLAEAGKVSLFEHHVNWTREHLMAASSATPAREPHLPQKVEGASRGS